MGTLNYSSTVSSSRTATEMSTMLAKHGASQVSVQFEDGRSVGLAFTLRTPHGDREFALPINVEGVLTVLTKQARGGTIRKGYSNIEQAERTAWRVARDWLAAQLAITEAQMASLDEVMLPYLIVEPGPSRKTLYTRYREHEETLALTAGEN
jgi:hypothetical protein